MTLISGIGYAQEKNVLLCLPGKMVDSDYFQDFAHKNGVYMIQRTELDAVSRPNAFGIKVISLNDLVQSVLVDTDKYPGPLPLQLEKGLSLERLESRLGKAAPLSFPFYRIRSGNVYVHCKFDKAGLLDSLLIEGISTDQCAPVSPSPRNCISGNCQNGSGVMIWPGGERYEGNFSNTLPDGQGEFFSPFSAPLLKYGFWENGKLTKDETISTEICLQGDCKTGLGEIIFPSGNGYYGEFKNGSANGYGTYKYVNGESYLGAFTDGVKGGWGIYKTAEKDVYAGFFSQGVLNGHVAYVDRTGNVEKRLYKSGLHVETISDTAGSTKAYATNIRAMLMESSDQLIIADSAITKSFHMLESQLQTLYRGIDTKNADKVHELLMDGRAAFHKAYYMVIIAYTINEVTSICKDDHPTLDELKTGFDQCDIALTNTLTSEQKLTSVKAYYLLYLSLRDTVMLILDCETNITRAVKAIENCLSEG